MPNVKKEPSVKQESDDELHVATRLGSHRRRRRSWLGTLWNAFLRQACNIYFQAESLLEPYVRPYYKTYFGPADDAIRPYFQTFYTKVYHPAATQARAGYEKYGAPTLRQTQHYMEQEWDKAVKPRMDKLNAAIHEQYRAALEPYVSKVYGVVSPPIYRVWVLSKFQYHTVLVPNYEKAVPLVRDAYVRGQEIVVEVIYPYSKLAAESSVNFMRKRVWPTLRIVYGQNVEPQLSKIRQRLGSYKDAKSIEAAFNDEDQQISAEETASVTTSIPVVVTSSPSVAAKPSGVEPDTEEPIYAEETTVMSSVSESAGQTSAEPPSRSPVEDVDLTEELARWQRKFTRAADKGAADLEERVGVIANRQLTAQVHGTGKELLTDLKESSDDALDKLKHKITRIIAKIPRMAPDPEVLSANEKIRAAIRSTGQDIKDKAEAVRSWKKDLFEQLDSLVKLSAESTLEVIDNIRDLGLQEIGMRWASMESVSYKDWEEYNKLKKSFDEWRNKINSVATEHEGLRETKEAGEERESRGMDLAQEAAEELGRLKNVATWKLFSRDTSQDWSDKTVPPEIQKRLDKAMERVSQMGEKPAAAEIPPVPSEVQKRLDKILERASKMGEKVAGTQKPSGESLMSDISESATQAASDASSNIGTPLSSAGSSLASVASEAMPGTTQPTGESMTSMAKERASSVASKVSDSIKVGAKSANIDNAADDAASPVPAIDDDGKPIKMSGSILEGIMAKLKTQDSGDAESVGSSASSLAESAKSSLTSAAEDVSETVGKANLYIKNQASSATESVASARTEVADAGTKMFEDVASRIKDQESKAVSAASDAMSSAKDAGSALDDQQSTASSVASSVLQDAKSSMTNVAEDVIEKVAETGSFVGAQADAAGQKVGQEEVRAAVREAMEKLAASINADEDEPAVALSKHAKSAGAAAQTDIPGVPDHEEL